MKLLKILRNKVKLPIYVLIIFGFFFIGIISTNLSTYLRLKQLSEKVSLKQEALEEESKLLDDKVQDLEDYLDSVSSSKEDRDEAAKKHFKDLD